MVVVDVDVDVVVVVDVEVLVLDVASGATEVVVARPRLSWPPGRVVVTTGAVLLAASHQEDQDTDRNENGSQSEWSERYWAVGDRLQGGEHLAAGAAAGAAGRGCGG